MQVSIEAEKIARLHKDLMRYNERAIPFAARNSINQSAFELRKLWQREINRSFITRNRWTVGSIAVDKTRSLSLPFMFSETGSLQDYMQTQERGGTQRKRGKHGVAIPTAVASREGRGARPRRRTVTKGLRMKAIGSKLAQRSRTGTKSQRTAASIAAARKKGRRLVFLELRNGKKGIFRVGGSKKKPKIDMLYDLTRPSIRIPREPTLERSLNHLRPKLAGIHIRSLLFQWNRLKLGAKR